jgi:tRNA pseudouridine38-40 synthase
LRNIKLTFQYDGTDFCGYELQPNKRSVRREIERSIFGIFRKKIKVISVSRTDSGVHALCNVVNFKVKTSIPVSQIPPALNSLLPKDIRVIKAEAKDLDFNARYDVKSKEYEYLIYNGGVMPPALRQIAWHVKPNLDLKAMRKGAKALAGKHDFSSFCAARSDDKDFVKTLYKVSVLKKEITIWNGSKLPVISCKVKGNGFLYKMVRNIVGTLIEVGIGKRITSDVKKILTGRKRTLAGRTAPAHGLCLIKVNY